MLCSFAFLVLKLQVTVTVRVLLRRVAADFGYILDDNHGVGFHRIMQLSISLSKKVFRRF